jgi:hypothetical protein
MKQPQNEVKSKNDYPASVLAIYRSSKGSNSYFSISQSIQRRAWKYPILILLRS